MRKTIAATVVLTGNLLKGNGDYDLYGTGNGSYIENNNLLVNNSYYWQ